MQEEFLSPAYLAAKDLYYLTCEMHAELWRLERMAQAYRRFEILRLRTGALSAQADAALRKAKPYIAAESAFHPSTPHAGALGSRLPVELEGELDRAACALAAELRRVEEMRQNDVRVSDFNVETGLFARMDEVRARLEQWQERAAVRAEGEAGMPSALVSCSLWALTSSLHEGLAEKRG
jgi:hypothetical protein